MKYTLALSVALLVLVGSAVILFVADVPQRQLQQTSYYTADEAKTSPGDSLSGLPSFSSNKFSAVANTRSEIAVLDNDLDNDGNYDGLADPVVRDGFFGPLAAANKSEVSVGVLDNDLDHDGNPDGIADPLVVVEVLSALAAWVSSRLLLALYKPKKLFSIWPRRLEQPG